MDTVRACVRVRVRACVRACVCECVCVCCKRQQTCCHCSMSCLASEAQTRRVTLYAQDVPPVYDLYAVSNHFGGMGGGHYNAYCKLPDGKWWCFDDSHVHAVDKNNICSSSAYVLFYRRRHEAQQDTGTPILHHALWIYLLLLTALHNGVVRLDCCIAWIGMS